MYILSKEKGNNSNITLTNMETKSSIILGKITIEILDILEKEGISFGETEGRKLTDKWEFKISEETSRELSRKAFKMHKPDRDQRKEPEETTKQANKKIDAMDVLLGLANYV